MVVRGLVWWSFGGDRSGSVRLSGLVVLVQVGSLSSVLNFTNLRKHLAAKM